MMFLQKALAFAKRDLIERSSYKFSFVFDFLGIFTNLLTFFLISKNFAGENYFPFVLIGLALGSFQGAALHSFASTLGRERSGGTLEAILVTPTPLGVVLVSGALWNFLFAALRVAVYLLAGALFFRVDMSTLHWGSVLAVLGLSIVALAGFGLLSAGFTLVFKGGSLFNYFWGGASRFLSGVYFPVSALPAWLQGVSFCLPLTYSLEAMRRAVLQGAPPEELGGELLALGLFSVVLLPVGAFFLRWALMRAKQEGSLVFY